MSGRLEGKAVVVTGAAWDTIGGAVATRAADEGAYVVINAEARGNAILTTEAELRARGASVEVVIGDVARARTWRDLVQCAISTFGSLDGMVYVPAQTAVRPLVSLSSSEWDRCFAVTLRGAFLAAKAVVPAMARHGGSLVFISTVNAWIANPGFASYSAAKAGMNALVRTIALENGFARVRANAIAPGQIEGDEGRLQLASMPEEDSACRACHPIGRYGTPTDVANAALFLLSDEASFITGTVLTVDGGLSILSPEALMRPSFRARWDRR